MIIEWRLTNKENQHETNKKLTKLPPHITTFHNKINQ